MIATALFASFAGLFLLGTPVAVALGLSGALGIWLAGLGILAVPTSAYTGIAKYPLLAVPMFVLVGALFDRSGVATRLVTFAQAVVGHRTGSLAAVTVIVSMFLGGISGSGPATAAAVGGAMIGALSKAGYPRAFSASVVGAAAATDILIPPSIALIIYSVLVPQASVPALFAAGMIPGILVGIALLVPVVYLSKRHGFGDAEKDLPPPPFWASFREAIWGLLAPVLILGGMRAGWFTPTEAAVMAVAYGLFVGFAIYRSLTLRDVYEMLVEAAEISGVILIVVALASIFAWAGSTLGVFDRAAQAIVAFGGSEYAILALLIALLIVVGMFLDGISIFLIMLPLLMPIANRFAWDPVWFGILLTLMVAIGQFTPPVAVNLMVSCRIAGVPMEATLRWIMPLLGAVLAVLLLLIVFPQLALWLPRVLGY